MNFAELVRYQLVGKNVAYTNNEAIYLSTPFTGDSEVRFGQPCFRGGGVIDGKRLLCRNSTLTDAIDVYLDGEDPENYDVLEAVDYLLEMLAFFCSYDEEEEGCEE